MNVAAIGLLKDHVCKVLKEKKVPYMCWASCGEREIGHAKPVPNVAYFSLCKPYSSDRICAHHLEIQRHLGDQAV